jgi:hypothetical protein
MNNAAGDSCVRSFHDVIVGENSISMGRQMINFANSSTEVMLSAERLMKGAEYKDVAKNIRQSDVRGLFSRRRTNPQNRRIIIFPIYKYDLGFLDGFLISNLMIVFQKSKRLRPIREPRKLAASFVKAVTTQIADGQGGIARNGALSLFSSLQRMLPRVRFLMHRACCRDLRHGLLR